MAVFSDFSPYLLLLPVVLQLCLKVNNLYIKQCYKYKPLRNLENVKAALDRLIQVIIEKHDFEKIIARFDKPNNFFWLVLPYFTREHLLDRENADSFTKHEELVALLSRSKGSYCYPTIMTHSTHTSPKLHN